eukprot:GHVR01020846.1.p1 GENE.GHVR01020846.1~~GHVR01020846.1.p1  ORF type:complete len:115 (+),score=43.66 GHVR01020846.1:486-830(+)
MKIKRRRRGVINKSNEDEDDEGEGNKEGLYDEGSNNKDKGNKDVENNDNKENNDKVDDKGSGQLIYDEEGKKKLRETRKQKEIKEIERRKSIIKKHIEIIKVERLGKKKKKSKK